MNMIKVNLEGDGCWKDLESKIKTKDVVWMKDGIIQIAALSKGMRSGKPSLSIRFDLPGGKIVVAETSMQLFLSAAELLRQRYQKELIGG